MATEIAAVAGERFNRLVLIAPAGLKLARVGNDAMADTTPLERLKEGVWRGRGRT